MQPPADHDGRADALLVPQQDEVLLPRAAPSALLGDGGEVDVVVDLDGIASAARAASSRCGSCQPGRCRA